MIGRFGGVDLSQNQNSRLFPPRPCVTKSLATDAHGSFRRRRESRFLPAPTLSGSLSGPPGLLTANLRGEASFQRQAIQKLAGVHVFLRDNFADLLAQIVLHGSNFLVNGFRQF